MRDGTVSFEHHKLEKWKPDHFKSVFIALAVARRKNYGKSSKTKRRYNAAGFGEYLAGLEVVRGRIEKKRRHKTDFSEASTTSVDSKDESYSASLAQKFVETALLTIEENLGVSLDGTGPGKFIRWKNLKLHPHLIPTSFPTH